MQFLTLKTLALACALCATVACSQSANNPASASGADSVAASAPSAKAAAKTTATDAKAFCTKLQPALQPLVKIPLTLFKADDSTIDSMHAGESQYVDCDFRQQSSQIDVSLHDDSDHDLFDNPNKEGYATLSGFGDKARYSVKGAMGMRWVDVVRGSVACEARLTADDDQINGDWKQAAGKMCDAAFAAR